MQSPRFITVYGNTSQNVRIAEIALFLRHLAKEVEKVEIIAEFDDYLLSLGCDTGLPRILQPSADSEMVLTLGGDGTLLHALSLCGNRHIPLLGVNTGHLGFLTAYTLSESHLLLADLRGRELVTEWRTLLQLSAPETVSLPGDMWPYAINEVALLKADTSSMINVRAVCDGHYLTDYRADGLIISTPTGSTGYNLSAGGPIVMPMVDCIVLTPIAAHTLTMRPLVVGGDSKITLHTQSRANAYRVSLDGRSFILPTDTTLEISIAKHAIPLVRRPEIDFARTLRTKLHWGNGL